MAIIQLPQAPALSLEDKKAITKQQIGSANLQGFMTMKRSFELNMKRIWANDMGLSPQEVLDAFGADAGELFALANKTLAFMNDIVPGSFDASAPNNYTVNEDGTVTIGEPK